MHFKPLDQAQFHLFMSQVLHPLFASWSYTNFSIPSSSNSNRFIQTFPRQHCSFDQATYQEMRRHDSLFLFLVFNLPRNLSDTWHAFFSLIYVFFPYLVYNSFVLKKLWEIYTSTYVVLSWHFSCSIKTKGLVFLLYRLEGKIWLQFVWPMPWCLDLLLHPSNAAISKKNLQKYLRI